MRFFAVRAKDLLCWLISVMVLFFALGLIIGNWGGERLAQAVSIDLNPDPVEMDDFSLEVISVVSSSATVKRVYIYHTHTYEAYEMDAQNQYKPTETWRTADSQHNMIRVGAELKKRLEEAGIQVTHDTTAYEPPRLSSAYSRSLEGLKAAAQEGYDLYIDLHRDSYSQNNGPNTVEQEGKKMIRFLFLIGQGTGNGFDERPEWEKNQRAAQIISDALNDQTDNLSRGVSLKSGRYNQQAATPAILIEAGNNKNTLNEALAAMPSLAQAICQYFDSLE